MGKLARFCSRHPDRAAIGVCVVNGRAICAECSTQYRGVNYSKEGLAEFLASQQAERGGNAWPRVLIVLLLLLSPLMLVGAYAGLVVTGEILIDVIQAEDAFSDGVFD